MDCWCEMFAKSCPWLEKAVSADPCLITGPRGCGKSTMFRWMSLKAHLADQVAELEEFNVAGFYISCASDLQNRFDWITTSDLAEKYNREIIHYFNLLLAREVVLTLNALADHEEHREYWGCGASEERAIQEFVFSRLDADDSFRMQGVRLLRQTLEVIEREMFNSHSQMMRGLSILRDFTRIFPGRHDRFNVRDNASFPGEKNRVLDRRLFNSPAFGASSAGSEPSHMGAPLLPYFQTLF